jgi:amidase
VIPLAPSLDVVGLLARSARELSEALAVAAPGRGRDLALDRVLVPADADRYTDEATARGLAAAGRRLSERCGRPMEAVDVSWLVDGTVGDLFARIQGREIWAQHSEWVTENIECLAPDVQTRLRRCEALAGDADEIVEADLADREAHAARLAGLLGEGAVLLWPVLPRRGPLRAWSDDELLAYRGECFRLTAPSSLGRGPQVVFPGEHAGGRFAGSVLGPVGTDEAVLDLVRRLGDDRAAVRL